MAQQTEQKPTVAEALLNNSAGAASWYAVVDAARDSTLPGQAAATGSPTQSLYAGEIGAGYSNVAPHLVALDMKGDFAARFCRRWGASVGIVLQSSATFDELRKHLRKFLLVKNEAGTKCRFRYYDPRVLRSFLPACTPQEAAEFFGPVTRFFAEGRNGASVLVFTKGPRGATQQEVQVRREPSPDQDAAAAPGAQPEPTGTLVVAVVDADTNEPIVGASVQASGPVVKQSVTGRGGLTRFESIQTGKYEVFAINADLRSAKSRVTVKTGKTRVQLACRAAQSGVEST